MSSILIGSAEAADILGIDRATFNRWVVRGDVPIAAQLPGGIRGPRLFNRADIMSIVAKKRMSDDEVAS